MISTVSIVLPYALPYVFSGDSVLEQFGFKICRKPLLFCNFALQSVKLSLLLQFHSEICILLFCKFTWKSAKHLPFSQDTKTVATVLEQFWFTPSLFWPRLTCFASIPVFPALGQPALATPPARKNLISQLCVPVPQVHWSSQSWDDPL